MKYDVPHKPPCFYWINYLSGYQQSLHVLSTFVFGGSILPDMNPSRIVAIHLFMYFLVLVLCWNLFCYQR
jgi:hypothetical protein